MASTLAMLASRLSIPVLCKSKSRWRSFSSSDARSRASLSSADREMS
jgi:hypothetical protein